MSVKLNRTRKTGTSSHLIPTLPGTEWEETELTINTRGTSSKMPSYGQWLSYKEKVSKYCRHNTDNVKDNAVASPPTLDHAN